VVCSESGYGQLGENRAALKVLNFHFVHFKHNKLSQKHESHFREINRKQKVNNPKNY